MPEAQDSPSLVGQVASGATSRQQSGCNRQSVPCSVRASNKPGVSALLRCPSNCTGPRSLSTSRPTPPLHLCLPLRRDGLQRLTQLIFSKAQPKRLGNQILSGPMLAGLTEAYVSAINNGWVACQHGGMGLCRLHVEGW